jgi:hypothetical protein
MEKNVRRAAIHMERSKRLPVDGLGQEFMVVVQIPGMDDVPDSETDQKL